MTNRGATWQWVAGSLALIGLARANGARGEDRYWLGGSGDWSTPARWGLQPEGPGGAGVPLQGESAYLWNTGAIDWEVAITPGTGSLPDAGSVFVDGIGGGAVTLRIDPGAPELQAYTINIGMSGGGQVVQAGGSVSAQGVYLSSYDTGTAGYTLSGGRLDVGGVSLEGRGAARSTMIQSGGTNTARGVFLRGAGASYALSAGRLEAGQLSVNDGATFTQTGGSMSVGMLRAGGDYRWLGGDLSVGSFLYVGGRMTFPDAPVSIGVQGVVEFDRPELINARNVSLTVGANSVVSHPADFNPATAFGSYQNAGLDHIVGTVLVVPAGRQVLMGDGFDDPIVVYGSIVEPADAVYGLSVGPSFAIHPGGSVEATTVSSYGTTSTVYGGTLKTRVLSVSARPLFPTGSVPGLIEQQGGSVTAFDLEIADEASGEYRLHEGELVTDATRVAPARRGLVLSTAGPTVGVFDQTGGTHRAGVLRLGEGAGTDGTYRLSGGALHVDELNVGDVYDPWPFAGERTWGVGRLRIDGADARLDVTSSMTIGPLGELTAVPGVALHLRGASLSVMTTSSQSVAGLDVMRVVFDGPETPTGIGETPKRLLEVAGEDRGSSLAGFVDNFVIDSLQLGGDGPAWVRMVDLWDNQPGSSMAEALYVRHLILNPGSTLELGGLKVYALDFVNGGGTVELGGGELTVVPEPGLSWGGLLLPFLGRRQRRRRRRSVWVSGHASMPTEVGKPVVGAR